MGHDFVGMGIASAFLVFFISLTWKAGEGRRSLKRSSRMYKATKEFRQQLQELSSKAISVGEKLEKIPLTEKERQKITSELAAIQYALDKAFGSCRTDIDRSEKDVKKERETIISLINKRIGSLEEFLPAEPEHDQGGEK
ncbi:MAG: hypothetical protein ACD_15C00175G0005 [uncultured bacterium]|nr:MAG: hypothetical protein ACD_15C00175G0005 [uncultured bacterium]